jgi:hypothetical protein
MHEEQDIRVVGSSFIAFFAQVQIEENCSSTVASRLPPRENIAAKKTKELPISRFAVLNKVPKRNHVTGHLAERKSFNPLSFHTISLYIFAVLSRHYNLDAGDELPTDVISL